ncbi:MAG TPA: sulfate ABC transporter substrate-binding protein [Nocardioidaceae bacterium]|nr:sulfate ABC transporter substrate-binding protein [Nocardioidaceae bacterium]
MSIKFKAAVAASVAGLLTLTACGGGSEAASGTELNLVGFSVLEAVNKEATAAFEDTDAGKDVGFLPSYSASGDQSRAVEAGKAADLVHFSLEPDMKRVVEAGIVADDWNAGPTKGIASQSVVVFVVRTGNPENIQSWDDLIKPGVEIITPNPASSGSAKWNLLAAFGQAAGADQDEAAGKAYLQKLFGNAVALPESARDATTLFTSGTGDVLLSYENEAILAKQSGTDFDYVVPDTTLLIENPAAVTVEAPEAAQSFFDFLISEAGQAIYATYGFRPLVDVGTVEVEGANDPADPFPAPGTLLTIADAFGGWDDANSKYFDETEGIITKLLAESGQG